MENLQSSSDVMKNTTPTPTVSPVWVPGGKVPQVCSQEINALLFMSNWYFFCAIDKSCFATLLWLQGNSASASNNLLHIDFSSNFTSLF